MAAANFQQDSHGRNFQAVMALPFAIIGLRFAQGKLMSLEYLETMAEAGSDDPVVKSVCLQIQQYLASAASPFVFDVAMQISGTAFQKKVLRELSLIPYGETVTYGEIAKKLNSSPRAVGNACRRNPIPLIIPCHRVVAANGLGGYDGDTAGGRLSIKRFLLQHEKASGQ